jgi:integrase
VIGRAKGRGNNEGSSYRRNDGYWVGQYGVQTAEGTKTRYIYGKRREDVREKLTKAIADRDGGLVYDAGNITVGEYLDRWLNDSVRDTVRQRTWERYEQFVRVHLTPALGKIKLAKLTPAHVRGLYRDKLNSGLAPRTVLHIHRAFSKALKQAAADGLIPRNPAAPVKPPQPRGEEIRPLNREQVRVLFEAASGDRLEALYIVAVTAGLRRGELQGLKWEDLDLEAGMLQVRRTCSEPKGGHIFEAPKSGKGRNIRLTQSAVAALRMHRRRQLEERMYKADLWQEQGLVFPSTVGTPLWGGNLNRAFKATLQRAGLPKSTRFHDLRHTCATLLLKQAVNPKFVQELLGHADISLTLNVYSHVLPDMGDATADAMEAALG